jgi:hypothetical protein
MSIWKVKIFKMIGGLPNPAVDQLLGTDTSIVSGIYSAQASLSEGKHTIYALSYDVAGNQSNVTTKTVIILPSPFQVSSGVDWQIGEIGAVTIGECN